MPGEIIDRPNPDPLPSDLPDELNKFAVQLQDVSLDQKDYDALIKFRRAACYIAAGGSPKYVSVGACSYRMLTA